MKDNVPLNFKVERPIKELLEQLVVLKTVRDNKKSSQKAVFEEALVTLLVKYKNDHDNATVV